MSFQDRLKKHHLNRWSGRALFSAALPWDFFHQVGDVLFVDGILVQGQLNKTHVSNIVQVIVLNYGNTRASEFLTDIPRIVDTWLVHRGFSIGFGDCVPLDQDLIREKVAKTNIMVETLSMGNARNVQEEEDMEKQIASAIASLENEIKNKMIPELY